jgi:hypothetical protein
VLKETVKETIENVPETSIPKFVLHGLRGLRQDANTYRATKNLALLPGNEYEKYIEKQID